jgi:hypothetical protein
VVVAVTWQGGGRAARLKEVLAGVLKMPVVGEVQVGLARARLRIVDGDGDGGAFPAGEEGLFGEFVWVVTVEAAVPRRLARDGRGDWGVIEGQGLLAAFVAGRRRRRERRGRLNGLQLRGCEMGKRRRCLCSEKEGRVVACGIVAAAQEEMQWK